MGQDTRLDPKYKTMEIGKYIYNLTYITNVEALTTQAQNGEKAQSVNLLLKSVRT